MAKLAGAAAEGMICSQAGLPAQAASKEFHDAFKAKYGEVKQYAPFFYDAANILIAAMQKADSTDPAKYLPEIAEDQLQRRDRQDRVRRQGRPQGRRDHDLHDEERQASSRSPSSRPARRLKFAELHEARRSAAARRTAAAPAPAPAMAPAPAKDAEEVSVHRVDENGVLRGAVFFALMREGAGVAARAIRTPNSARDTAVRV